MGKIFNWNKAYTKHETRSKYDVYFWNLMQMTLKSIAAYSKENNNFDFKNLLF